MAYTKPRIVLSNDPQGQHEETKVLTVSQTGNFTAVTSVPFGFVADKDYRIVDVILSAQTFPTSTDRTATATVEKLRGTTAAAAVCSTNPAFAATASGSGIKSTAAAGTGITQAVMKTDGSEKLVRGDMLILTTAFAGANGTIGTGATVTVVLKPDFAAE